MFTIEMLPAVEGDALWVEYGDPNAPHRILIDGGYKTTYRVLMDRLDRNPDIKFELMVLTHIDGDHIAGAVPFIADGRVTPERVKQVWFNGREQIRDVLGVNQAEYFTRYIKEKNFEWNAPFGGDAIVVPDDTLHAPVELEGGLHLTLLSPRAEQLNILRDKWNKELDEILKGTMLEEVLQETPKALQPDVLGEPDVEQLAMRPFEPDDSKTNGSSIAFLAEFEDPFDGDREKRVLFCGDAFSPVVEESVRLLLAQRGADRLLIDALKLSHHGSKSNTSADLLGLLRCHHFLFSTDGSRHSHPDSETIARVLKSATGRIDLHFNYLTSRNRRWRAPKLTSKYHYEAHYPTEQEGLVVSI
jgi:beta-lactamase superfamily II metal-dependent hydrolase